MIEMRKQKHAEGSKNIDNWTDMSKLNQVAYCKLLSSLDLRFFKPPRAGIELRFNRFLFTVTGAAAAHFSNMHC